MEILGKLDGVICWVEPPLPPEFSSCMAVANPIEETTVPLPHTEADLRPLPLPRVERPGPLPRPVPPLEPGIASFEPEGLAECDFLPHHPG